MLVLQLRAGTKRTMLKGTRWATISLLDTHASGLCLTLRLQSPSPGHGVGVWEWHRDSTRPGSWVLCGAQVQDSFEGAEMRGQSRTWTRGRSRGATGTPLCQRQSSRNQTEATTAPGPCTDHNVPGSGRPLVAVTPVPFLAQTP